ncbi:ATP-binding protein [Emticicia sp. 21SJ11W-3]|uniref:ATP-binding protein n=1 Tax=Emticicia sp. 21SJ11W-3 TaxID=2916755 RepID=UPI00209EB55B|nr:ATP-binding protein [Emticicia sp. 21SJ11W-3]UTA67089.1 histidine kinase [Emticicia sp. 21SJ11W-3]
MSTLERQVTKRLTKFYILALTAVAVLSITGQMLIQHSLKETLDDAHVVNIAGRQRMLSQRLSKMAILLTSTDRFSDEANYYEKDFAETLTLWTKCHEGFMKGSVQFSQEVAVKNSASTVAMLQELDPVFRLIKNRMELIGNEKTANKHKILDEVLLNERLYLNQMDKIVFQYDQEAEARVKRVQNIELLLFVVTISILVLEGLLIFRPLTHYIKQVIKKLLDSEEALQQKNLELSMANQKLLEAQENIIKITAEKYELIRKEDNVRSGALLEGQEEERRRLSRELHDGIGQMLTGLKLNSERLKDVLPTNEKQKRILEEHNKLIDETIGATREVSFNLMPPILTDFGLGAAIRLLAENTTRSTGIKLTFESNLDNLRLNSNLEVNLYRIVQEALNNIMKHAKATEVFISLNKTKTEVELLITDNGIGFDPKSIKNESAINNGLSNMQTRVHLSGGQLKIHSIPTKGTQIIVKIPKQYAKQN